MSCIYACLTFQWFCVYMHVAYNKSNMLESLPFQADAAQAPITLEDYLARFPEPRIMRKMEAFEKETNELGKQFDVAIRAAQLSLDEYNRALDKAEKINRAARPVLASCALIVLGAMEIECHTVAA